MMHQVVPVFIQFLENIHLQFLYKKTLREKGPASSEGHLRRWSYVLEWVGKQINLLIMSMANQPDLNKCHYCNLEPQLMRTYLCPAIEQHFLRWMRILCICSYHCWRKRKPKSVDARINARTRRIINQKCPNAEYRILTLNILFPCHSTLVTSHYITLQISLYVMQNLQNMMLNINFTYLALRKDTPLISFNI